MFFNVSKLIQYYHIPVIGRIAKQINMLLGVDIPRTVKFGKMWNFHIILLEQLYMIIQL